MNRAEELTQEVFADAAAGLPEARPGDPPVLAWLYTVARRRFVDDPSDYGPFLGRAVHEAIEGLPGGQSRVVVLKLLRGLSFAEIGAEVGLTEAAAKMRFKRALEALRDELSAREIEP